MLIKSIRYDIGNGGFACGPSFGSVVAIIEFEDDKGVHYLSAIEFEGIPCLYYSEHDIFDDLVEEKHEVLESCEIYNYAGVETGEYKEIFNSLNLKKSCEAKLFKLLIAVIVFDHKATKKLIKNSVNRDIKDIKLPPLRKVLEDYLD